MAYYAVAKVWAVLLSLRPIRMNTDFTAFPPCPFIVLSLQYIDIKFYCKSIKQSFSAGAYPVLYVRERPTQPMITEI